jgi:molecular chaperone DnaK (HSP70)
VRVLNEPTAAALAYGIGSQSTAQKTIVVYDLGGGTLDVTVMAVQHSSFRVIATSGDSHLGGEDFN